MMREECTRIPRACRDAVFQTDHNSVQEQAELPDMRMYRSHAALESSPARGRQMTTAPATPCG